VHARRLKPRGSLKSTEERAKRINLQGYECAASHGGDEGTSVLTHWHVLGRAGTGCLCMLGLDEVVGSNSVVLPWLTRSSSS
jgi:hypothetical protein